MQMQVEEPKKMKGNTDLNLLTSLMMKEFSH